MNAITPIQAEVLRYIITRIGGGLPPSHREIASHFGWSSNATAKCHLLGLEKKSFIRTTARISRGIQVLSLAREWYDSDQRVVGGDLI